MLPETVTIYFDIEKHQHIGLALTEHSQAEAIEHNMSFRQKGREGDHARSVTYQFVVVAYCCVVPCE
jgi:hypothetical protein